MNPISNHSLGKHPSTLKLYFEIRLPLGSLTNGEVLYPCGCASHLEQAQYITPHSVLTIWVYLSTISEELEDLLSYICKASQ